MIKLKCPDLDAYRATRMKFNKNIKNHPFSIDFRKISKLEELGLLGNPIILQKQWKPSEEQLEALESATENCAYSEYQDCLRELIGQLKKL